MRKVLIKKKDLIATIKENKITHIKEYGEAVEAYKIEAKRQLKELLIQNEEGITDLKLELVTPQNNSKKYDSIIELFNWEIKKEIELTEEEFKNYVQDDSYETQQTFYVNNLYNS